MLTVKLMLAVHATEKY